MPLCLFRLSQTIHFAFAEYAPTIQLLSTSSLLARTKLWFQLHTLQSIPSTSSYYKATLVAKVPAIAPQPTRHHTRPTDFVAVPSVPCSDFSGRVLRVGSSVTKVAAGDYVAGFGKGCAAQLCVVADTNVVKLSGSKNLKVACAAGVVTLTASECLRKGEVSAGSTVVVIGASGGVGHVVVQMAKNAGACVIGICRHNLSFCFKFLHRSHSP